MTTKTRRMNPHTLGILMVLLDSLAFSLMSLFVKLSGDVPTMQKAFFRNAFAIVIAVAVLARSEEKFRIKKGNVPLLIARSFFGAVSMMINFWAIDHLGMADANILNKMSPFFAILASIVILAEIPNLVEIAAIIIAFIGAAFVVKPTAGLASMPALIGLMGGMGAGIAYTFVRKLGQRGERGPVIVAFFSMFTMLMCTPNMILNYHPMSGRQWLCLLGAGLSASLGQFTITAAYRLAPAKEISVFDYSQVLFAAIWGILFFGELPDRMSLIGYVIIIGTAFAKWYYTVYVQGRHEA